MSDGQYSVIRYTPDPGRGERLNIGILLWDEQSGDHRLNLDEKAVERVIKENPRLELNSLLYIEPMLIEQLATAVAPGTTRIKSILDKPGFPLNFTEPRDTRIAVDESDEDKDALDATLDRLVKRIVRPKRRGGYSHASPTDQIATRLKPLIRSQRVARAYQAPAKSGVERHIDFYANSGANVALDVLQLAITKADDIRDRADAKGMKVLDLLGGREVKDYLVYCHFSDDRQLEDVYGEARTIIECQGAKVLTDPDEAATALSHAASKS